MSYKVSSQFNQVITTTPQLEYNIELGLGGYEDVHYSGSRVAVATKLNMLRSLHNAWERPQPQIRRQPFDVPLPSAWRVENWMIVDGVFGIHSIAQGTPTDGKRTRLDILSLHDVAAARDPQARRRSLLFDIPSCNSVMCLHQQLVILIGEDEYVSPHANVLLQIPDN